MYIKILETVVYKFNVVYTDTLWQHLLYENITIFNTININPEMTMTQMITQRFLKLSHMTQSIVNKKQLTPSPALESVMATIAILMLTLMVKQITMAKNSITTWTCRTPSIGPGNVKKIINMHH